MFRLQNSSHLNFQLRLKHIFLQKILRRNSHVPWVVHPSTVVHKPENISPGNRNPGLSRGCHIDGRNGIKFGNNCWVGPYVSLISMNHSPDDLSNFVSSPPIILGNNCWLGAHSIILAGVQLGDNTIVGAGSVVTKSFVEGHVILAGNPAVVKRELR